jgi:hypothetical protein
MASAIIDHRERIWINFPAVNDPSDQSGLADPASHSRVPGRAEIEIVKLRARVKAKKRLGFSGHFGPFI